MWTGEQTRQALLSAVPWPKAEVVEVTFGAADTDTRVPHNLGTTSVGYLPLGASAACAIYDNRALLKEHWTRDFLVLRASAPATVTLLLVTLPA